MAGVPNPLAHVVSLNRTRGASTLTDDQGLGGQYQYLAQWGADWKRAQEWMKLKQEQRFFQHPLSQQTYHVFTFRITTPRQNGGSESIEMNWLVEHSAELEQYKGEWLLIHGRDLINHSRDFTLIRATIGEREIRSPFVYYVPTDEESNFASI